MAGHSKWANIRHRKERQDAKKGKVYTKIIREITVAARGGADMNDNPRLRNIVEKALTANMSRDIIDRAIKRGAGGLEGADVEDVRYEGYGPSGIAVIVECMTNNRNRTVSEVRHLFSKSGGNLGTDGSVSYLFKKQGQITFAAGTNEEKVMEAALEVGAEDVVVNDDTSIDVFTSPDTFYAVKNAMVAKKLNPEQAELTMVPMTSAAVEDKDIAQKAIELLELLEDLEDVQAVYSNLDIVETV
ncbi:MAG TPA: YebC/PmpR family DNA-binding transcriptional regulator [Gammaproteobacteria bacterium]|nr:YebC/PmpR family DNA-binding transcriptional regulator [Gammaproteobacteria bacterium]